MVGIKRVLVGVAFCLHVAHLDANPDGAPASACQDMTPQHVRLTANDVARPFKGLFAQARDANNSIVGTFIGNEDMKVMDCSGGTLLHNLRGQPKLLEATMLLKTITVSCLVAALLLGSGESSPNGAPVAACGDMAPQHNGTLPQSSPSPYTATITAAGADMFN
ncbi:hypothetical protein B566_EDAN007591 [Ephemera danica]|nr:hypothetical protein B566_EDAN007591 [Ephemera danica]